MLLCTRHHYGDRASIRVWCRHRVSVPGQGNQVRTRCERLTTPGPTRRKKSTKSARRGSLSLDNRGPHKGSARGLVPPQDAPALVVLRAFPRPRCLSVRHRPSATCHVQHTLPRLDGRQFDEEGGQGAKGGRDGIPLVHLWGVTAELPLLLLSH